ncbi:hypothetical protein EZS27_021131 [termite gut metagenome]|uniref:Uncharacterized protein n=1 Tax=termite gut metagenome TaxID=433724 RepID=A0A5J4R8R9_9ZZZZ
MTQQWVETGIQIIILIIGLYLALFKSYFHEKGKNLATLEDIKNITKIAEQIKANISLFSNLQLGIFSEERTAIIDSNNKYFQWLNLLLDSSLNNIDTYDNKELQKYLSVTSSCYQDFLNSETRFNLFVDNNDLSSVMNELKIETLKLISPHFSHYSINMQKNNNDIEHVKMTITSAAQKGKYSLLFDEREKIHSRFCKQIINNYKQLIPLIKKFQKLSREHIYKLIKDTK